MFIWQLLFPNNKQGKEKREECIKLGIVEVGPGLLVRACKSPLPRSSGTPPMPCQVP